jgi:hypothetical protein
MIFIEKRIATQVVGENQETRESIVEIDGNPSELESTPIWMKELIKYKVESQPSTE